MQIRMMDTHSWKDGQKVQRLHDSGQFKFAPRAARPRAGGERPRPLASAANGRGRTAALGEAARHRAALHADIISTVQRGAPRPRAAAAANDIKRIAALFMAQGANPLIAALFIPRGKPLTIETLHETRGARQLPHNIFDVSHLTECPEMLRLVAGQVALMLNTHASTQRGVREGVLRVNLWIAEANHVISTAGLGAVAAAAAVESGGGDHARCPEPAQASVLADDRQKQQRDHRGGPRQRRHRLLAAGRVGKAGPTNAEAKRQCLEARHLPKFGMRWKDTSGVFRLIMPVRSSVRADDNQVFPAEAEEGEAPPSASRRGNFRDLRDYKQARN